MGLCNVSKKSTFHWYNCSYPLSLWLRNVSGKSLGETCSEGLRYSDTQVQYCNCRYDGTRPQRTPQFAQTLSHTLPFPPHLCLEGLLCCNCSYRHGQTMLQKWTSYTVMFQKWAGCTTSVAAIVMARHCFINELFSCNCRHGETMFQKWTGYTAPVAVMARRCFINE